LLTARTAAYVAAFIGIFLTGLIIGSSIILYVSLIPLFVVLIGLIMEQPRLIELAIEPIPESLWVGDIVDVNCNVEIKAGFGIVILSQKLPSSFELVEGNNIQMLWKGLGQKSSVFSYKMRCSRRGKYELAPVRWESRHFIGLTQSQTGQIEGTAVEFTVKPKILNIRRIRGIIGLATSPMPVIDIAKIGVATTDFREIRNYVVGDPVKTINWKATARRASMGIPWPLVNEYEVEGKKTVWIFLDGSYYMQVGTSIQNPFEYALEATNGVIYYYLDQGYRVGMYIYNHNGELFYPDAGKRQFNKLSRELIDLKASEHKEDLPRAIDKCRRYILGYNPLCVVVTRLDGASPVSLIDGAKKLARLRGRMRKRLPLIVISISGYHIVTPHGPYDEAAAKLRHLETRPLVRRLRASGSSVLEWNPRKTDFGSALLRQVRTR
jgi:uncharacterized protein (DUF58 family)